MVSQGMNYLLSFLPNRQKTCPAAGTAARTVNPHPSAMRAAAVLLLALATAVVPMWATEKVTLQKSGASQANAQDSWIDQANTGTNHGGDTTLQVSSQNASRNQRSVVQFDLSGINNSGIKSAVLTLFMSTAPTASRTYGAYRLTSRWLSAAVTWASRITGFTWAAAGGDENGAATGTATTGTTSNVSLNWTITADVQQWFGAATPMANYGTIIQDQTESSATARSAVFSSMENATTANRPSLAITFQQNVQALSSTAGNAQVLLKWSYPATVGTVVSATNGVLILRAAGGVIAGTVVPTDGTTYTVNAGCANNIGGAQIVFVSSSLPTQFNDSAAGDNASCPPVNGTLYAYKVFSKDAANNYSANGATSQFVPLIAAEPNTSTSGQLSIKWVQPTASATLAAPGIIPGQVVALATASNVNFSSSPSTGLLLFNPLPLDAGVTGRPPLLQSATTTIGSDVEYLADGNGFVYAVNPNTGASLWSSNPTASTANTFTAGAAVLVKSFATASYTGTHDLVVVGTRNGGTTTGNSIIGMDGNTGAVNWTLTGNAAGNPAMDIVAATPFVDYVNNTIWATSHSNGGATQPSLWKVNPNTGARLATANLGNISNPPYITVAGDVLFVGNDAGTVYAINTSTGAVLNSFAAGDTQVTGSVVVLNFSSPYQVIFSGATTIKAIIFNKSTNTFTTTGAGTWSITMPGSCNPSGPVAAGAGKAYVGCSDGAVYQVDIASGTIDNSKSIRPGDPFGDATLDVTTGLLIIGSTNTRVYALAYPF